MNKKLIGTIGVCLVVSASPCLAGDLSSSALRVKNDKGIPYVSGGVGIDERDALRTLAKDDNLSMSFAAGNKAFLGGAQGLIKDAQGKTILEAASDGPLFFAKLPAGTYGVEATAMGKTLKQTAHLAGKGSKHLYFVWNLPGQHANRHA